MLYKMWLILETTVIVVLAPLLRVLIWACGGIPEDWY